MVDVCKAVQDMNNKARLAGKQEGLTEGRLETLLNDVKNVMESLKMTVDDAMNVLKVSKEDQAVLRKML